MTTVTIEVDDDLFAKAGKLAAARSITLSEMLRRLLQVAANPPFKAADLPPLTRQALGMLPTMSDDESRRALDEARMRKHGP